MSDYRTPARNPLGARTALLEPVEIARRQRTLQELQVDPFRMLTDEELSILCPPCQNSSLAGTRTAPDGEAR